MLELGQRVSGPYCGKILAGLGAKVVKVEPPEGDEARRMGPFPGEQPHLEKSGLFLALNVNKYSVTLDLNSRVGRSRLLDLASEADVVVDNNTHLQLDGSGLGYDALRAVNPETILTSITPFGRWGPYAGYKATDLTLFHMSGHAHTLLGPVQDPDSDPPIRAGGHQADLVAGMTAATVSLMALYRKRTAGLGCHIVVSSFEAMVTQAISGLANCAYGRPAPDRDLKSHQEASIGGAVTAVGGILPCTDGYVAISPREDDQWSRWLELMGNPAWGSEERFSTREGRQNNFTDLWELVAHWTASRSKYEIARQGQERRIPCFPVNTVEDLLRDPHLRERRFFVTIDHLVAGTLEYPGAAYRFSNAALPLAARPAPLLGEHNDLILGAAGDADG